MKQSSIVHFDDNTVKDDAKLNNSKEYLQEITTKLDLAEDLKLYRLHYAISNEYLSVVGITILSQLWEIYGGKKYLLRGYHKGQKYFEVPLDEEPLCISMIDTTIAFVPGSDSSKICVMDVGGTTENGD